MLLAANKTKNSMNIEEAREYCLSLKNVTECFPFDDVSLVFKVEGKMFLLLPPVGVWTVSQFQCGGPSSQNPYPSKTRWAVTPPTI